MKLRKQLALVSLVALVIPWAGLQALQVFDELLRHSHMSALTATARAVAARIGADTSLRRESALSAGPSVAPEREIYVHSLPAPPVVDGQLQDWRTYPLTFRLLNESSGPQMQLAMGRYGDRLYIATQVADGERRFHDQTSDRAATGDHLVIYSEIAAPEGRYYVLSPPLPGPLEAKYRDLNGHLRTDYRLQGVWRETPGGYQVELSMPAQLGDAHFAVAAVDQGRGLARTTGTLGELALLAGGSDPGVLPRTEGRLVEPTSVLSEAMEEFASSDTRISLLDNHGWLRAQTGAIAADQTNGNLTQRLMHWANPDEATPEWRENHSGRWQHSYLEAAQRGEAGHEWWRHGQGRVAAVAVPVPSPGESEHAASRPMGTLVVEQRVAPWRMLDNVAAFELVVITLGSGLALLAVLVGYASWLSWRIRRLSRAAERAGDEQAPSETRSTQWPQFLVDDELSELSGHYRHLLGQVQAHTDYLRTLTGKLSHELRTPLAVVSSSLDNLQNAPADEAHKYASRAREGCQRLSAIVSAMTEASRVEASIASAEAETVDIAALVNDITQAYQTAYPDNCFRAHIETAETDAYRVEVAPELLVQMLDKLVDNATGYSPAHVPIELSLALRRDEHQTPFLRLAVSNEGPQLPDSLAGRLFQSLTSDRDKRADGGPHLGLGLYIVGLIARHHGGRAQAENIERGVRFTVDLPARYPGMKATRP